MLSHTCNPNLYRRLKLGGSWFKTSLGKNISRDPHLNRKKLGVVVHTVIPVKARSVK
jgi:hypothetical protein